MKSPLRWWEACLQLSLQLSLQLILQLSLQLGLQLSLQLGLQLVLQLRRRLDPGAFPPSLLFGYFSFGAGGFSLPSPLVPATPLTLYLSGSTAYAVKRIKLRRLGSWAPSTVPDPSLTGPH